MTSKERMHATLNHKQPDRVPIDINGASTTCISAYATKELIAYKQYKDTTIKLFDPVQMMAFAPEELLAEVEPDMPCLGKELFPEDWKQIDFPRLGSVHVPQYLDITIKSNGEILLNNAGGAPIAKMPVGAAFFDQTVFPYEDGYPEQFDFKKAFSQVQWQTIGRHPYQLADREDFYVKMRESALNSDAKGYPTAVSAGCNFFEIGCFTRRMDNFLMDLLIEQDDVLRMFDGLLEMYLEILRVICESLGDIVSIIRFSDDMGMSGSTLFSRDIYQKLIKPYHKRIYGYVHEHSNAKVLLHSCGSVYNFIPDLIDAGVDILNPVQIVAANMSPSKLKNEFGKDLVFWGGGCDISQVLPYGAPAEIREHVLRNMEIWAPGGGFVFAPSHNILAEVPPQNILAMYNAYFEFNGQNKRV